MSDREARREKLRREQRKSLPTKLLKQGLVTGAVLVVLAGAAYGFTLLPEKPRTVHWHPTWEVYAEGENVRWTSDDFDMSSTRSRMHFHLPDDNTIHAEGPENRLRLGTLFTTMGGELSDTTLGIPEGTSKPGAYETNVTHRVRVFVQPPEGAWQELESGFADYSFEEGARVLVTYGDLTPERIAQQQESVQAPKQEPAMPPSMVPGRQI